MRGEGGRLQVRERVDVKAGGWDELWKADFDVEKHETVSNWPTALTPPSCASDKRSSTKLQQTKRRLHADSFGVAAAARALLPPAVSLPWEPCLEAR